MLFQNPLLARLRKTCLKRVLLKSPHWDAFVLPGYIFQNSASQRVPSFWDWWHFIVERHALLVRLIRSVSRQEHRRTFRLASNNMIRYFADAALTGVVMQMGVVLRPFQGGGAMCSQGICHCGTFHSAFEFHVKWRNLKGDVIPTFSTGNALLGDSTMGFMEGHYGGFSTRM